MQIYECERPKMKRDMDLIRDLLLEIERNPLYDGTKWVHPNNPNELGITNHSFEEVDYHLVMLVEEEFVKGKVLASMDEAETVMINKLTWEGHELLDNIRDPGIWGKTKARLKGLQSVGISVLMEIAKAEIKAHLGLP